MSRPSFREEPPVLRLSAAEYAALPVGRPMVLWDSDVGLRWREICWGGARIRELRGVGPDGYLVDTYRPVIRVKAVSRLVPRPQALA